MADRKIPITFTVAELCDLMITNQLRDIVNQKNYRLNENDPKEVERIKLAVQDVTAIFVMTIEKFRELDQLEQLAQGHDHSEEKEALEHVIYETVRLLKLSCAIGSRVQAWIIATSTYASYPVMALLKLILTKALPMETTTRKQCWQLVGNLTVNHTALHHTIWLGCIDGVVTDFQCPCASGHFIELQMILYNLYLGESLDLEHVVQITEFMLSCYLSDDINHPSRNGDFYQIFLEHLITQNSKFAKIYSELKNANHRFGIIEFANVYVRDARRLSLSSTCLETLKNYITIKASTILNVGSPEDSINPKESCALLDLFGYLSGTSEYRGVLSDDCEMFMTIGFMLVTITEAHTEAVKNGTTSVFSPERRPERFAPEAREANADDPLFDFKTNVMRIFANMTYQRKGLQDLARKLGFLEAVFNSTQRDTRNPLLQEWSILCIRNMLENNEENQRFAASLEKKEATQTAKTEAVQQNGDHSCTDVEVVVGRRRSRRSIRK